MRQLQKEILTGEMKFFYVFLNLVTAKDCCWYGWSGWEQSSLTCGEVCRYRKRGICRAADFCVDYNECDTHRSECKWHDDERHCRSIPCRELIF